MKNKETFLFTRCNTVFPFFLPGHNVSKIWADIYETILAVYLKKQPTLIQAGTKYKSTRWEVLFYLYIVKVS